MTDDADAAAEEVTDDDARVESSEGADGETADDATPESNGETATGEEESEETATAPLDERVANHDEELAEELREERAEFEARIDELESKLARKQADFQNFKKRQKQKLEDQRARATEDLIERLLPVRDNLARALEQDADADIREGVEGTRRELDRVLAEEGAERIEPEPGEEPDPDRHEVMMRVESDQPAGTVAELFRPGYEMGDRVIRTAQVTVSEE